MINEYIEVLKRRCLKVLHYLKYGSFDRTGCKIEDISCLFDVSSNVAKRWFSNRCMAGRIHEEHVIRLFAKHIIGKKCFADVGACLGYYSIIAASKVDQVFAFELDDNNVTEIENNMKINQYSNITAVHKGVSNLQGEVSYHTNRKKPVYQVLDDNNKNITNIKTAKTISLDQYFKELGFYPDIIKIDVEGYECKVIDGASEILKSKPVLFLEVHPEKVKLFGGKIEDIMWKIFSEGYSLYEIDRSHKSKKTIIPPSQNYNFVGNPMLLALPISG